MRRRYIYEKFSHVIYFYEIYLYALYFNKVSKVLAINEPVDYMAQAVIILMRGKDITWAIGRGRP